MDADLDPELAEEVAAVERLGLPAWHQLSVQAARRVEDELFTPEDPPPVELVRNHSFDGPDGEVPVRVYRDVPGPAPALVFYHGGGFVMGTLDSADDLCRRLARRAECVVASIDYRLAPEHPFPAAVDDAYAALEWVAEAAPAFGGDPERLRVAGTSAGGCLAAATAHRTAAFDGPSVDAQTLLYPMLDPIRSPGQRVDGPLLTGSDLAWFWEQYLRSPVDAHNPFAAPLRATDFSGLPPATVATAGHDPLAEEGAAYAERLADAGVAVSHRHYPSLSHGFLSFADAVRAADEAFDDVASAIRSPPE